jgi:signal transduction histidine kinase
MADAPTAARPRDPVATFDERLSPLLAGLRQRGWLVSATTSLPASAGQAPAEWTREQSPGTRRVALRVADRDIVLELRWIPAGPTEGGPEREASIELAVDAARTLASAVTAEFRLAHIEQLALAHSPLRSVASLLSGLAHDIRSPLTSIVCNVEALEGLAGADREAAEALGDAKLACDRIEELVRSVRLLTDADAGNGRVDVAACVQAAVHLLRLRSSRTGVPIEVTVERGLVAQANPTDLCQALYQLVENALDVSPRGSSVHLRASAGPAGCAIEVDDAGPGFPGIDPEELFRPFRTRKPRALGTNLASARAVARKHGGDLVLRTPSPGSRGACFVLTLLPPS